MTYIVKNSVSKYIVTTHDIKTVFELYKYHTYMWFHMNCNVLVLWKGIGIYCSIVSSRICRRDWSAETGLSLLSTMAPRWKNIWRWFQLCSSLYFLLLLYSSFFYRLLFNSPHHTHIQRWTEWHGHTTQKWMTWHGLEPPKYRTTGTHHSHSTTTRNYSRHHYKSPRMRITNLTNLWMQQTVPAFTVSHYTVRVCWPVQFSANVEVN